MATCGAPFWIVYVLLGGNVLAIVTIVLQNIALRQTRDLAIGLIRRNLA